MAKCVSYRMDSNGRVNGKVPVFNDVLAFLWNKMCRCAKVPLVKVCMDHFKAEEVKSARDLMFEIVPASSDRRRVKHRGLEDILTNLYDEFQALPTDSEYMFVALNLNNLPNVSLADIDGACIVYKQASLNASVAEIATENKEILSELAMIKEALKNMQTKPRQVESRNAARVLVNNPPRAPTGWSRPLTTATPSNLPTTGTGVSTEADTGIVSAASSTSAIQAPNEDQRNEDITPQDRGEDEFQSQRRRRNGRRRNMVTGRKAGNELGAVAPVLKCKIFVSRLNPDISAERVQVAAGEIINDSCDVQKLQTKFNTYSSFYVTCDVKHRDKILDPEMWEKGVLIRPFYGFVQTTSGQ